MAEEIGQHCLQEAEQAQDSSLSMAAHWMLGSVLHWRGQSALARQHRERSLALSTPEWNAALIPVVGQDVQLFSLVGLAHALTRLGYGDQARGRAEEALALARQRTSSFSLVQTLMHTMLYHHLVREVELAEEQADEILALTRENDFAQHQLLWATVIKSWAMRKKGLQAASEMQIRQCLTALTKVGAQLGLPYLRHILAETLGESGQPEAGLAVIAESLTKEGLAKTGNTAPQLYITKGNLLLQLLTAQNRTSVESEAEESFLQALRLARLQEAKMIELRAAIGLSQLWRLQGKKDAARRLLAQTYD